MTSDQSVAAVTARIRRMAEEPRANGDYFALTDAGREAVRQILNETHPS